MEMKITEEPKASITLREYIEQSEIQSYDDFCKRAKEAIEEYNNENRTD